MAQSASNIEVKTLLLWSIASDWGIFTSSVAGLFSCFAYSLQSVFLVQYYRLVYNRDPMLASISAVAMGILNAQYGTIKPFMLFGVVCGVIGSGLFCMLIGNTTLSESILSGLAFGCIPQASLWSAQVQIPMEDPDYNHRSYGFLFFFSCIGLRTWR